MSPPAYAPPHRSTVVRRKPRIGEREFMERVQCNDGFWKGLTGLSKATGKEVDELEGFAQDICRSVFSEAGSVMESDGPLVKAREEVDLLKQKLRDCNLSAMKQMLAAKSGVDCDGPLGDDTITFHEPMQYLEKEAKELVMSIVCDKMRQLEHNTAPPSLVQALMAHADAEKQNTGESASMEELKELKAQLEDARVDLKKARLRADDAEDRNRQFEARLKVAEDRAHRFEAELIQTKAVLATTEAKLASAEEALAKLRAEHVALMEAHAKLQKLSAEQQAQIERQTRELAYERKANEKLRAEIERLQEYVKKAEELERKLKALQLRFDELEKEATTMRAELARRNNTRTCGTQTTLTGDKLDELSNERRKLKLMLEELQTKLKELMTEYRRKFGDAATKIANQLGLKELLKEETVFQRLYDDALDRVSRLETLRAKVKSEKRGGSQVPSDNISIMQAVEENQPTVAMQRLVQDKFNDSDRPLPPDSSMWSTRPQRHEQACGQDEIAKQQHHDEVWQRLEKIATPHMKASSSLPSLPKQEQHLNMVNLKLGQGRKVSKRSLLT